MKTVTFSIRVVWMDGAEDRARKEGLDIGRAVVGDFAWKQMNLGLLVPALFVDRDFFHFRVFFFPVSILLF
jgi:hypothetical protein